MKSSNNLRETPPAISIILPCRNEATAIERCVQSILSQKEPGGGCEVLVADGMSNDGTRAILDRLAAEYPRLRIIDNPGRIVSTGLNEALTRARGQIILRFDAHTEYAPDYVQTSVSVLKETGADNVGGPARTKASTYTQRAVCAAYHSPFSVGGAKFHDVNYEGFVDTVPYGCWPAAVFRRFGLFDEELIRNQDDEFNLRITRGGGKIWQSPRIQSWYFPRSSLRSLFKQYMQYGYWKVRVIQKHHLPASLRHLIPGIFVGTLLLLLAMAPFWVPALAGLIILSGFYAFCVFVASLLTARRTGWDLLPVLPLVFACYHLGYGYGFLRGLLDFVLLRKGGGECFSQLTRSVDSVATAQPNRK